MVGSVFDFEDVRSFVAPKQLPAVWVEMSGLSYCDSTYRIDRICSDVTVIEYVISGTGSLYVGQNTYHPAAGDVYILHEKSDHSYIADKKDPWVKIFVNLKGTAVAGMLQAFGLRKKVVYPGCEELYPVFAELFEATKQDAPTDTIMEQCAMILAKLLSRMSNKLQQEQHPTEEARALKSFIDSNYQRDLTMNEIAQSIFRSNDYANKLFKRFYDNTPYAYYIEAKISHAKALLLHTSLSISQVAERLGYKNDQYFSKQFRKVTGMTATRFRANFRDEKNGKRRNNPHNAD